MSDWTREVSPQALQKAQTVSFKTQMICFSNDWMATGPIIFEHLFHGPLVAVLAVKPSSLLPDLLPKHDEQHGKTKKDGPLDDSHLDE